MPSTATPLYLRQLPLGPMKNFVYLLGPANGTEAAVIDPAWDAKAIEAALEADGRRLSALLITHHHGDHLNALPELLSRHDVPVYAQRAEVDFAPVFSAHRSAVRAVGPGDIVSIGALEVACVHTPGHTPGSQCFHCHSQLLSGDTVFVEACGRCDLPGGNMHQMYDSLHRVLGALDASTTLWPGHDYGPTPSSTLGHERKANRYLTVRSLEAFVEKRRPAPRS